MSVKTSKMIKQPELFGGSIIPNGKNVIIDISKDCYYVVHTDGMINGRGVRNGEIIVGYPKNKCGFYRIKSQTNTQAK